MGQHKSNPTAQAAKRGELPPKPSTIGAAERKRRTQEKVMDLLIKRGLIPPPFR